MGERMVEPCRADLSGLLKIVFRMLRGFRADRKAALVGPQDGSPGYAQNQTIDSCGPERQVRMSAASVWTRIRAEVPGRCPHPKSAVRQRIFDANPERERIARLWMEDVLHHRPVWLALGGGPGDPADEAVDCIAVLRLVQRELVAPAVELVAAILKPVRPRRGRTFIELICAPAKIELTLRRVRQKPFRSGFSEPPIAAAAVHEPLRSSVRARTAGAGRAGPPRRPTRPSCTRMCTL